MSSRSAWQAGDRPFYAAFGWAYDLLITDPVQPWTEMVSATLDGDGIATPAQILDVGCGTGRHAAELARHGYRVELLDASASLLAQARARLPAPRRIAPTCVHWTWAAAMTRSLAVACSTTCSTTLTGTPPSPRSLATLTTPAWLFLDVRDAHRTWQRYADGLNSVVAVGKELLERVFIDG